MGDRRQQRELLGYVLGALDDRQRQRIDQRRSSDPGLEAELARIEQSLEPLRSVTRVYQPPPGLAQRTCRMIFAYSAAFAGRAGEGRITRGSDRERARAMSPAAVPPASTATWGWSDLVVAVSVFLAVAGLVFPAVQSSRMNMRLVSCQNNLRQIGQAHGQCQLTRPVNLDYGILDQPPAAPVSYASLPGEGALVDLAPAQAPRLPRFAMPMPPLAPARGSLSAHQGFTQTVHGQNLLFLDGHVTFLAMSPIVDPILDPSSPDDPFPQSWPSDDVSPAAGPGSLAPIVPLSRPER
jgi:prepilin-type processing-associated H-X9-DG protein